MPVSPAEETPPREHDIVQRLVGVIDPQAVPIDVKRSSRLRPMGLCYWNVNQVIKENGGSMVLGWHLLWWPDLYGTAVHHAVWRHPQNGRLVDVSQPQPDDRRSPYTLFLPNDRYEVRLDKSPLIDNVLVPIAKSSLLIAYFECYKQRQVCRRSLTQCAWQLGARNEQLFALAAGEKPPPGIELPAASQEAIIIQQLQATDLALSKETGKMITRLRNGDR